MRAPKLNDSVHPGSDLSDHHRRARRARWAVLVRIIVTIALALQLTGVLHAAADAFSLSGQAAITHFVDDDDTDCPPGCPSCHHVNGGIAAPPPSVAREVPPADEAVGSDPPYRTLAAPSPAGDSLFRPPRATPVTRTG